MDLKWRKTSYPARTCALRDQRKTEMCAAIESHGVTIRVRGTDDEQREALVTSRLGGSHRAAESVNQGKKSIGSIMMRTEGSAWQQPGKRQRRSFRARHAGRHDR